jgi:hypothetical protein
MNEKKEREVHFKALKAFGVGGSGKIDVVREPRAINFSNAKGGLRLVGPDDVRALAKASAEALTTLTLGSSKA